MIVEYYGDKFSYITNHIGQLCHQFSNLQTRIGVINWWWLNIDERNLDSLKQFVERQDICFFISEEIFEKYHNIDVNAMFELLNQNNVYYILFSEDNNLTVKPAEDKSFYNPWFFKSPLSISTAFQSDLLYKEKPYTFNLMLGSKKSHRTLAFKALRNNNKIYSSYLGHPDFKFDSATFLDDDDIQSDLINQDVNVNKLNTMNVVSRNNQQCIISHIVPEKIYANTHFDIVTETFVKQGHNFLTEKTAKPLATGRFFCWYASCGLKAYLERYGFEFDNYFTNYDSIPNDLDRFDEFLNTVEEISSNESLIKEIYSKTKHIRMHNMKIYWERKNSFNDDLGKWMSECLQK